MSFSGRRRARPIAHPARKRYVCPVTEVRFCETCGTRAEHRREELVRDGQPIPTCELHQTQLVEV